MDLDQVIEKLETRRNRLISFLPEKKRLFFSELEKQMKNRAVLLYGPRGVGKTTFLLFMSKDCNLFYVSGDDPLLLYHPFYELAEKVLLDYPGIIIDEAHSLKDWSKLIKALYDSFPNKIIWISDSSSVLLRKGIADLSRRFVSLKMPLVSLREYIYLETGQIIEKLSFPSDNLLEYATRVIKQVDVLQYFRKYREGGTRPFYLEGNFREKMINILEKTIYYDIPHLIGTISENHFGALKAVVSFLLYSKIPTINVESMCREWGIGKPKLYQLLYAMEEVGLVNIVRKEGVEKAYSKGSKIFFADPAFYFVFEGETGNFREAFTVFALKERIRAAKREEEADFVLDGVKLEIGGRGKVSKHSDYVIKDDLDLPVRNSVPLWMLGMLW
ncbi:MAG: uncharacterized protein PWP60_1085 [Candidatus Atribacteria bacterium]|jgi:hypothetical protein|nr:uncharacterized protein [Candidatus Atribacteria bacterium]